MSDQMLKADAVLWGKAAPPVMAKDGNFYLSVSYSDYQRIMDNFSDIPRQLLLINFPDIVVFTSTDSLIDKRNGHSVYGSTGKRVILINKDLKVLHHELGHILDHHLSGNNDEYFFSESTNQYGQIWQYGLSEWPRIMIKDNYYTSVYGTSSPSEDFAETVGQYLESAHRHTMAQFDYHAKRIPHRFKEMDRIFGVNHQLRSRLLKNIKNNKSGKFLHKDTLISYLRLRGLEKERTELLRRHADRKADGLRISPLYRIKKMITLNRHLFSLYERILAKFRPVETIPHLPFELFNFDLKQEKKDNYYYLFNAMQINLAEMSWSDEAKEVADDQLLTFLKLIDFDPQIVFPTSLLGKLHPDSAALIDSARFDWEMEKRQGYRNFYQFFALTKKCLGHYNLGISLLAGILKRDADFNIPTEFLLFTDIEELLLLRDIGLKSDQENYFFDILNRLSNLSNIPSFNYFRQATLNHLRDYIRKEQQPQ
jgi:hypothetical protein